MKVISTVISSIIFILILSGISVPKTVHAALDCSRFEFINGRHVCELTHTRPSGFLHTSHLWSTGSGGAVSPRVTFSEITIFRCTCVTSHLVIISVDFTIAFLSERSDAGVIPCPNIGRGAPPIQV